MHKSRIDIPVLMLFFNRPKQLEKVFEQVKIARPSKLYLFQDGAREGREDDLENVQKCREIVENIDWECEVHKNYQEKNNGCDPSEYLAQKWMFETEEMGIVLEDDDVPSQSFFPFCKELLEKYKDDERINIICAMNNTGVSKHISDSYLFTKKGSIWGWASWKRVIDTWDGKYTWLDDKNAIEKIKSQMSKREFDLYIETARKRRISGKEYYETILAASMYLNDRLNIVPKYNMMCNVGIAQETTHSVSDIRLMSKIARKLFYMKTYEIEFPLSHPKEIKRDYKFEREMTPGFFKRACAKVESVCRVICYGGFSMLKTKIKNRRNRIKNGEK